MRTVRYLCWLYIGLVGVALLADIVLALTTDYGGRIDPGCNFTDALLVGVKCQGFIGADALALFLNWPLFFVYAPMFALSSAWMLIPTVLLWLPVVYLVTRFIRRRHAT